MYFTFFVNRFHHIFRFYLLPVQSLSVQGINVSFCCVAVTLGFSDGLVAMSYFVVGSHSEIKQIWIK